MKFLAWPMHQMQDLSLNLSTCSPAHYHCATAAPCPNHDATLYCKLSSWRNEQWNTVKECVTRRQSMKFYICIKTSTKVTEKTPSWRTSKWDSSCVSSLMPEPSSTQSSILIFTSKLSRMQTDNHEKTDAHFIIEHFINQDNANAKLHKTHTLTRCRRIGYW